MSTRQMAEVLPFRDPQPRLRSAPRGIWVRKATAHSEPQDNVIVLASYAAASRRRARCTRLEPPPAGEAA